MKLYRYIPAICIGATALCALADSALEKKMLEHVEKIMVIDSINVNRDGFFNRYRIQPSAGAVLSGEEVASRLKNVELPDLFKGEPYTGFTNEYQDYMIWAQEDSTGYLRLAESVKLVGGDWDTPRFTSTVLNFGAEMPADSAITANAAFPFMAEDGQTLYFAADNEKSLGGYDIFIATKDPSDGSFLIPGNIGMPFNSPYDDYMMVHDPLTGVGWWASDRNQLEDEITIYIYALTDERVNVDPSDENLTTYATLSGWESLLDEESQEAREKFLEEIKSIKKTDNRIPDFELPMPGGKTYRYYTDFKNRRSEELMKEYLAGKAHLADMEKRLKTLRGKFHNEGGRQLATQIQSLEKEVRAEEDKLKSTLSSIYKSEGGR